MSAAFSLADSVLKNAIDTITNIVFNCGTVNLDFNDLKTVLGDKGYGHLGIGYADRKYINNRCGKTGSKFAAP